MGVQLREKLSALWGDRANISKLAKVLSERLTMMNLDDPAISDLYKESYSYFIVGDLEKALKLLDDANLSKKVEDILNERNEIEKKTSGNYFKTLQTYNELKLQIDEQKLVFDFDRVKDSYRNLIKLDTNNYHSYWDYADFLDFCLEMDSSIYFFKKALSKTDSILERIKILNSISGNYNNLGSTDTALTYINQALFAFQALGKSTQDVSLNTTLSTIYNTLGLIYQNKKHFGQAKKYYMAVLELTPVKNDSLSVMASKANLGQICFLLRDFASAKMYFLESKKIIDVLVKKDSISNKPILAQLQINYGALLYAIGDSTNALKELLMAVRVYSDLVKSNALSYTYPLCAAYNNVATMYKNNGDLNNAEKYYLNGLYACEKVASQNPIMYSGQRDDFLVKLNMLYTKIRYNIDANADSAWIQSYLKSSKLYEREFNLFPENLAVKELYISELMGLSEIEVFSKQFADAELTARKILSIDSSEFSARIFLGHSLLFQNRFIEAEKTYLSLKGKKDENNRQFKDLLIKDLELFKRKKIYHPDLEKIKEKIQQWQ